ncbi:hypothetical protein ACIBFB_12635 [Nocardiopsis sp. NPDC050513]|uniref:hypothetical protein n=1 Tax=Nocardiopsis sp. NPDC050513 TaxID=3364338 RepID=UPI003797B5BE
MARKREFGPVQLARWLGLRPRDLRRAWALGLVPPPDVDGRRWSEELARTLPDRTEHIRAALARQDSAVGPPPVSTPGGKGEGKGSSTRGFGPIQLARWLGLENWQVGRGVQKGLIPPPDVDGRRWSEELARTLPDRTEHIRAVLGDHPGHGSVEAAKILAARTGLDVVRDDVFALQEQGTLAPAGEFRGWPMFAGADLASLGPDTVATVVRERLDWLDASLSPEEAADLLGWPQGRFEVTAERQGVQPGRFGRFKRAEVESLAEDEGHA